MEDLQEEKEIKISSNLYEKLLKISHNMKNQDNGGTASPYFYQIASKSKSMYIDDLNGDHQVIISEDGDEYPLNEEGFKDFLANGDIFISDEKLEEFFNENSDFNSFDIEEIVASNGGRLSSYNLEDEYFNIFFTKEACQEHIDRNYYHYNNPRTYVNYASRNHEMESVIDFLLGLS